MKKIKTIRQGDVLIVPIKTSARGKDVRENGKVILAHGEATGHSHEVIASYAGEVTIEKIEEETDALRGAQILRVLRRSAMLRHHEHSEIKIPVGTYRVIRQREYSPEAIRNVAD